MVKFIKIKDEEMVEVEKVLRAAGISYQSDVDLDNEIIHQKIDGYMNSNQAEVRDLHEYTYPLMDPDDFIQYLKKSLHDIVSQSSYALSSLDKMICRNLEEAADSMFTDMISNEISVYFLKHYNQLEEIHAKKFNKLSYDEFISLARKTASKYIEQSDSDFYAGEETVEKMIEELLESDYLLRGKNYEQRIY